MTTTTTSGTAPLIEVVRTAFLDRASGRLEIQGAPGVGAELLLRDGELYIERDSSLAASLAESARRAAEHARPAADPRIATAVERLATHLVGARGRQPRASLAELSAATEMIGPLPTVSLLLALAVEEADEGVLLERLGGEKSFWRSSDTTPALSQLPALEPGMARVMAMLQRPIALGEILRGGDRLELLRGLARLWAVGLAERAADPRAADGERQVASDKAFRRFLDRIEESLEATPLELSTAEHRALLAEMIGKLGTLDHYSLLGVEPDADVDAVSAAYNRLARRVHPLHASKVGLAGKEDAVSMLFERATEAYLVLSDPIRRSSYNTVMGISVAVKVGEQQRDEEKKRMARSFFIRGANALSEMDYSTAVEMLKEASRLDPQVRYLNMLGQAQSKNPRWRRHAVYTYEQAIALAPDDGSLHLALAQVLEKEERLEEAYRAYGSALDVMPDSIVAKAALERLREVGKGAGRGKQAKAKDSNAAPARRGLRDILARRGS